jgi:hypothetical protein
VRRERRRQMGEGIRAGWSWMGARRGVESPGSSLVERDHHEGERKHRGVLEGLDRMWKRSRGLYWFVSMCHWEKEVCGLVPEANIITTQTPTVVWGIEGITKWKDSPDQGIIDSADKTISGMHSISAKGLAYTLTWFDTIYKTND